MKKKYATWDLKKRFEFFIASKVTQHELTANSLPGIGKGVRLYSGTILIFHSVFCRLSYRQVNVSNCLIMRHCAICQLLADDRDTGRRRPVASAVDRDDGERILASLGGI